MVEKITKVIAKFLTNRAIVALILGLCEHLAAKTKTTVDDDIIKALKESGLWPSSIDSAPADKEPVEENGDAE